MNELMRESISRSIGEVGRQIGGLDEGLAGVFKGAAEDIMIAKDRNQGERPAFPIGGKVLEDAIRHIGGGRINTIPFGEPDDCLEYCLVFAFKSLNPKYAFNRIIVDIKNYWLGCGDINRGTLVIMDHWDIYDFYHSKYRYSYDIYTSTRNRNNIKHTVAIVLYGDYGFSLQYLR